MGVTVSWVLRFVKPAGVAVVVAPFPRPIAAITSSLFEPVVMVLVVTVVEVTPFELPANSSIGLVAATPLYSLTFMVYGDAASKLTDTEVTACALAAYQISIRPLGPSE